MLQLLRTKTFRIAAAVALLIALYALAGFVLAPKLVRSALLEDIPRNIDATPSVGDIRINPFLLQVTVDDFSLAGAGGEKLLGFRRLFIDFELSSIWHRAYSFANIDLSAPQVAAVIAKNGSLNLLRLRPKSTPPKAAAKDEPLPAVRIGSFKVSQGLATYEDRSRPDVFAARLEPINFELREFTTGVEGGKFTLTGSSKQGERIEWHGHVSVDPLESDGEFQIHGLLARTLWEYLQDQLNFIVDSGNIDLAATYKFSLKEAAEGAESAANLQANLSQLSLRDLAVRPKGSSGGSESTAAPTMPSPAWIAVPELMVTGGMLDLAQHRAHVDRVALSGVKLVTWLDSDGKLNLLSLATPPAPPAPLLTTTSAAATAPAWTVDLRRLDIRDASISAEDRSVQPAAKVVLAPFSLQVSGMTQDLSKPLAVTLDTRINEAGAFTVGGEVTPQPLAATVALKLSDIDLTVLQPYFTKHSAMTLLAGSLGGEAKLNYGPAADRTALQFAGNLHVDKLHTVDDALKDDFINWDRLDILGLNYRQAPDRLDIEQIVARKLYSRVIIESDESLNVKRVLKLPATPVGTTPATPTAATLPEPAAGHSARANSPDHQARPANAPRRAASPPAAQGMPMAIKKVVIEDGQANFTDLSVAPVFSAAIKQLQGTITGLSSAVDSRAKVDLHGAVDTFSPVAITGEVNVLGPLYTDLDMSFRNISLAVFNPYSGKFAGYNITKGKLSTELRYKIDGRKLDLDHHIVVEQLEFGDKTTSKDAVSLPIKLAVSLLKDRNGVIDLDIPVNGTLDDPTFRLAPIVWGVFVNILEKAVTAPFALLGSLFGGGPDIQYIDFKPGSSALDAAASDKAKTVAQALIERPQLKIDVPIAVVPELDKPALIDAQLNAQLSELQSPNNHNKAAAVAGAAPPAFDQLDPGTQLALLSQLYKKTLGGEPQYSDAVNGIKGKPEVTAAKVEFLKKALRDHIVIDDDQLRTLGQQRAMALQTVLLTDSQVEAERVFLVANDKAVAKDGAVRAELTLE